MKDLRRRYTTWHARQPIRVQAITDSIIYTGVIVAAIIAITIMM